MFERLENLIRDFPELADVGVAQGADEIARAEKALGVVFPSSFKEYLARYGTVAFGPTQYFGLGSTVADVVANTEWVRNQIGLPPELLVVCDHDGDEYVCLDTSKAGGGDCPVVIWEPTTKSVSRVRASTFEDFITSDTEAFAESW